MESRRPRGRKTAHLLTIFSILVFFLLLGCGGGQQANPASSSAVVTNTVAHSAHLTWARSSSTDALGYNVYRGTQSGGPYARLNPALLANPDYLDTTVLAGQTYYYAVTAVSAVTESDHSAEAVAVIPTP
jgi:fibronectin type 3 domain-containing protein